MVTTLPDGTIQCCGRYCEVTGDVGANIWVQVDEPDQPMKLFHSIKCLGIWVRDRLERPV